MSPWWLLLAAYTLGSLPLSYLVARGARGIDLRQHGSGNLGATNAFRVLGWKLALPIFTGDLLKGFVPAWWFPRVDGSVAWEWGLAYGAAAVLGHVFSVWVRFRGGKGIATGAGVFLGLAPLALAIAFAGWIATVWATRIVSVGSLVAAGVLLIALWLTHVQPPVFALGAALALFVVWTHRANIGRLSRGEEPRFGTRNAPAAPEGSA